MDTLAVVGERYIARFAAVGTIIEAINTETNVGLPLANRAVFFARARFFRLVTLRA